MTLKKKSIHLFVGDTSRSKNLCRTEPRFSYRRNTAKTSKVIPKVSLDHGQWLKHDATPHAKLLFLKRMANLLALEYRRALSQDVAPAVYQLGICMDFRSPRQHLSRFPRFTTRP
jgi:hypothetical protein